ncbi:MAG: hypothetical protein V4632_03420 [Pseudomonadota bacterium]
MIVHFLELDLEDVAPGMTLAEPVLDGLGGVLLPRGTVLSDAMLVSVRRRGIDHLVVLDDSVSEAELAEQRERMRQRLTLLFRRCGDQGASALLLTSIMQYRSGGQS